eukprot:COSAG06_NODE_19854_length_819_cov_16.263889_1_plen_207_part_01
MSTRLGGAARNLHGRRRPRGRRWPASPRGAGLDSCGLAWPQARAPVRYIWAPGATRLPTVLPPRYCHHAHDGCAMGAARKTSAPKQSSTTVKQRRERAVTPQPALSAGGLAARCDAARLSAGLGRPAGSGTALARRAAITTTDADTAVRGTALPAVFSSIVSDHVRRHCPFSGSSHELSYALLARACESFELCSHFKSLPPVSDREL